MSVVGEKMAESDACPDAGTYCDKVASCKGLGDGHGSEDNKEAVILMPIENSKLDILTQKFVTASGSLEGILEVSSPKAPKNDLEDGFNDDTTYEKCGQQSSIMKPELAQDLERSTLSLNENGLDATQSKEGTRGSTMWKCVTEPLSRLRKGVVDAFMSARHDKDSLPYRAFRRVRYFFKPKVEKSLSLGDFASETTTSRDSRYKPIYKSTRDEYIEPNNPYDDTWLMLVE